MILQGTPKAKTYAAVETECKTSRESFNCKPFTKPL